MYDINYIKKLLPHRYPFLLVDRILEMDDDHIVCSKSVSVNEPFFQGHFPDYPIMPGVLIVEGLAQSSALFALNKNPLKENETTFFVAIENAKFRKPVVPGDVMEYHVKPLSLRKKLVKTECKAFVKGELVCEATLLATISKVN